MTERQFDKSLGVPHLREILEEMGEEQYTTHSCIEIAAIDGYEIESFYDEEACRWCAFCMGYGSCGSPYSREDAIDNLFNMIKRKSK